LLYAHGAHPGLRHGRSSRYCDDRLAVDQAGRPSGRGDRIKVKFDTWRRQKKGRNELFRKPDSIKLRFEFGPPPEPGQYAKHCTR
jgi:hypothetical protein